MGRARLPAGGETPSHLEPHCASARPLKGVVSKPWASTKPLHAPLCVVWNLGNPTPVGCSAWFGEGWPGAVLPAPSHHRGVAEAGVGQGPVLATPLCLPFCFSPIFPSSVHTTTIGPTAQTQRLGVILDFATSLPMSTSPHLLLHSPESEPPPSFPGCPEPPPKGSLPSSCFSSVFLPHSSQQETVEKEHTIFLTGHTDIQLKDFFS